MPPPVTSPAMKMFGFKADRILRPYQNPDIEPVFRKYRPSDEEINSLGYDEGARQQDQMVLQEDLINQKLADQQAQRQQAQRKVARLEQVQDVEDQANEALASGMPVEQVIRAHPGLAQSPSFGNYMAQAKAVTPAQQTLAPHYRKMLKTPEERADFDQAFQHFGNVTQADDHARARAQERAHRVGLIDAGVPLEYIENAAKNSPLTAERAALLKQQFKKSVTGGDPRAEKVFETYSKMVSEGSTDAAKEYLKEMKSLGVDITPPAKVEPVAAATKAGAFGDTKYPPFVEGTPGTGKEAFPTHEQVRQDKAAQINAPGNDENFYSKVIADPSIPLPQRKQALEKFKEYVVTAPPPPHLTLNQVMERRHALDQAVEKADHEVQLAPELEKYNAKWSEAKNGIDELVGKTATRLGVPKQALINSLVEGEGISQPDEKFDRSRKDISIPDLLNETWVDENAAGERGKGYHVSIWDREHPSLQGFKNSKFADDLGTRVLGFIPKGKTFGDVLDAYKVEQKARRAKSPREMVAPPVVQNTAPRGPVGIKKIVELPPAGAK